MTFVYNNSLKEIHRPGFKVYVILAKRLSFSRIIDFINKLLFSGLEVDDQKIGKSRLMIHKEVGLHAVI